MMEIIVKKRLEIASDMDNVTADLLGCLVQGQTNGKNSTASATDKLTNDNALGNLFAFVIADHETTSSSLHMTLVLLALSPRLRKTFTKS